MKIGVALRAGMLLGAFLAFAAAYGSDTYRSFSHLARHTRECVDYLVSTHFRNSPVSVLAIHGGTIEPYTAELARAIAEPNLNLYIFEGLRIERSQELHVTSTRFDEPRALELARRSGTCLSIHGFLELERSVICIGGSDIWLRKKMANALRASGLPFEVEEPCLRLRGESPQNIVNRCRSGGVQFELSAHLRDRLGRDASFLDALAAVIRSSLP